MYRIKDKRQLELENFVLPFGGKLNPKNRWIRLARLIPWEEFEETYAEHFTDSDMGAPAKPFRVALGSLLIKERQKITDRETVEQIRENPYLQYLIGKAAFSDEEPFDASMMVHFRKRITDEMLREINERMHIEEVKKKREKEEATEKEEHAPEKNKGKLLVDATCTPADIRYPTDLSLLNEAREKTERILDTLHDSQTEKGKKPRTYREQARKEYLKVSKKRKPKGKMIRKGIKKQLQYLRRNLEHIKKLSTETSLQVLGNRLYKDLLVISELYRQQKEMYDEKKHTVAGRIVSISQPHVRPIVRGKANAAVEFGAKISVSFVDGYSFLETLSWDAYNEANELIRHIEKYKKRFGYYPESVHVDGIYRNRENRGYCKEHNIRISGPPLGRPPKDTEEYRKIVKSAKVDEIARIPIEGVFGVGKRRYGMARVMTKLKETSETAISMTVLVMNLEKTLRDLLLSVFHLLQKALFLFEKCLNNRIITAG